MLSSKHTLVDPAMLQTSLLRISALWEVSMAWISTNTGRTPLSPTLVLLHWATWFSETSLVGHCQTFISNKILTKFIRLCCRWSQAPSPLPRREWPLICYQCHCRGFLSVDRIGYYGCKQDQQHLWHWRWQLRAKQWYQVSRRGRIAFALFQYLHHYSIPNWLEGPRDSHLGCA